MKFNREREVFSTNGAGTTGYLYLKKRKEKKLQFLTHTMHKNKFEMSHRQCKRTMKLSEENKRKHDVAVGENFLDRWSGCCGELPRRPLLDQNPHSPSCKCLALVVHTEFLPRCLLLQKGSTSLELDSVPRDSSYPMTGNKTDLSLCCNLGQL